MDGNDCTFHMIHATILPGSVYTAARGIVNSKWHWDDYLPKWYCYGCFPCSEVSCSLLASCLNTYSQILVSSILQLNSFFFIVVVYFGSSFCSQTYYVSNFCLFVNFMGDSQIFNPNVGEDIRIDNLL